MFTSAGRRVSLIRHFRRCLDELKVSGSIYLTDANNTAPAIYINEHFIRTPRITDDAYIDTLLDICREKNISLLIPLIDSDLSLLSQNKKAFAKVGTRIMVSNTETLDICFDKRNTHRFLSEHNIPSPQIFSEEQLGSNHHLRFPMLLKPWNGSSSQGVHKISDRVELDFYRSYVKNSIVQEFIEGDEFTCDVYVDFSGKVRCVVPRKRLETRAGEVSKGMTVRDGEVITAVTALVKCLPDSIGCLTVQCFKQDDGSVRFIEINPRFGGGFPLSIHAGADFPRWIIQEQMGLDCDAGDVNWESGLLMLRYDDEIIVRESDLK